MTGVVQEDEILGKAYDSRLMGRLLSYLRPYRWPMVGAFLLIFATGATDLVPPYLTKLAIDQYIVPQQADGLLWVFGVLLGALALNFVFRYAQNYLMQVIGQRVMYDLRVQVFSHLQHQSLAYFDRNPVGRLISRLSNDIDALNEFISTGVVSVAGDLVALFGIIIVMLLLDWRLALVTLVVLPMIAFVSQLFQRWMRDTYRQQRIRIARVNGFLQENISGMLIVQLFNREKRKF